MTKITKYHAYEYETDSYEWRDCTVIERNGSLVYVEDDDTGERKWIDYRAVKGSTA